MTIKYFNGIVNCKVVLVDDFDEAFTFSDANSANLFAWALARSVFVENDWIETKGETLLNSYVKVVLRDK